MTLNLSIAKAFYRAGFIESWGRGIEKICNACTDHGVPLPEYTVHPEDILLLLKGLDQAPLSVTSGVTDKVTDEVTDGESAVLELLLKDGRLTMPKLADMLFVSRKTIATRIKRLKEKGLLEREGSDRAGRWIVKER